MKRDEAIKIIEDMANILSVSIPETIEVEGVIYKIKKDIVEGNREKALEKYQNLYERVRERIDEMNEVPEYIVKKALILRRAVLFLMEFRGENEIEDKKRWMEYVKKVSQ